jgi:hypothetical protein
VIDQPDRARRDAVAASPRPWRRRDRQSVAGFAEVGKRRCNGNNAGRTEEKLRALRREEKNLLKGLASVTIATDMGT